MKRGLWHWWGVWTAFRILWRRQGGHTLAGSMNLLKDICPSPSPWDTSFLGQLQLEVPLDCLGFFLQGKAPVLSNFGSFHPAPSCPWKWCLERHYAWWVKLSAAGELEFSTEDPSARADSPLHYNVPPPKTFRVNLNEFETLENKMNIQEIQSDLSSLSICKQEILGIISILHRTDLRPSKADQFFSGAGASHW